MRMEEAKAMDNHDRAYERRGFYTADDVDPADLPGRAPGDFPFRRGLHRDGFRKHSWVKKLISGYGTADETRERQMALWKAGQEGVGGAMPLHIVVDIPTADGYDSDHPLAVDEVGLCGVAIDSVDDVRRLVHDLPLDRLTTTFILAAPAPIVLAMYLVVLEDAGIARRDIAGQVWNNPLSEYVTSMWPTLSPRGALRTMTDAMRFCAAEMPKFRAVNLDGYNVRESGTTAVQEVAYMIAEGIDLVRTAARPGDIPADDLAKTITFSWAVHSDFFEEIAKFRAARQVYAELMSSVLGLSDPSALRLKAHAQTAGSTLTAQGPLNNVARVALEAMAAVLGGCQSMHTSSYDEALGIPTGEAAQVALMTQHIIDKETGVTAVADPLGGSWYLEHRTAWLVEEIRREVLRIESIGGFTAAVEAQDLQRAVAQAAFDYQSSVEAGDRPIVGVTEMAVGRSGVEVFRVSRESQERQIEMVRVVRRSRSDAGCVRALDDLGAAAASGSALMPALITAARARATLGEMVRVLQRELGGYQREVVLAQ
jgi:methylmalonyl-CoA mutase, N-terminal domain